MRILSAFFAVLFIFINPTMIVNVISQMESFLQINSQLPEHLRFVLIDLIVHHLKSSDHRIKAYIYGCVVLTTLLHVMFTCFSLYGIYSCRAKFMKPLIVDIITSSIFLLLFVFFSLFMYWRLNTLGSINEKETTKLQLRNMYVGLGFLVAYGLWAVITWMAHSDTRKLRADFMYWIEEERMSMRSRHNVSVDNRSDRSSKGSKASRASKSSARSAKSEIGTSASLERKSPREGGSKGDYQKVSTNSCNTSICKKVSVTNARLSVPL
ncbi:Protein CBG19376 [Caenorhabditis briggsae]|uniref:Uncharacterized protein n=2 Tax=Caenorhabditis briggsae TaxID=6238 RepID=A0AAE9D2D1_CAEBR|nr:Protein CBG19376 [Caenorhabditis briggsae]ULT90972.1 hypothetical protein L3Y34_008925 [Caenorhabditis briggsae]UMM36743.1 hypothetical protein L5515_008765 [Caenorhabditis briggsae]CAP36640.1 Protein CBG19376 [Caenorhabditis briggsae]